MNQKTKNKVLAGLAIVIVILIAVFFLTSNNSSNDSKDNKGKNNKKETSKPTVEEKVDIIDINSNTRPFAIVVNNTPVAVSVQEGLNKAYLVYEFPTEGSTSRLMALFKDVDDVTVGTIRSVRHNFIDFAYESNAILIGYGWSEFAQRELRAGIIDNVNGMIENPFWRNNPEGLATEHTAYTSVATIRDYVQNKGYSLTGDNTILLNYNAGDVDLSKKEGAIVANGVSIPYGNIHTYFGYDKDTKTYVKNVNDVWIKDYATGEAITTKNIIVEKIDFSVIYNSSNYAYWDLYVEGSGSGYYITNGYAVPIKWSKPSRGAKTTYTYLDGTEIEVSDGRTYIEVQVNSQPLTIE